MGCKRPFRAGSSPRVRGTVDSAIPLSRLLRFIPACAGNSDFNQRSTSDSTVHPRVCGEQNPPRSCGSCCAGSSPRVRGTDTDDDLQRPAHRFIPACAGNRRLRDRNVCRPAVHPRVCGEQGQCLCAGRAAYGSSPRVRGTVNWLGPSPAGHRFIPACAGNSQRNGNGMAICPVHPRVCGEQDSIDAPLPTIDGSSPRVRGTDLAAYLTPIRWRFIPACAGNSFSILASSGFASVHPRVCGEQLPSASPQSSSSGSSPRVRGTVRARPSAGRSERFIPACAGNSRLRIWNQDCVTVHPRVCGEQPRR